MKCKHCGGRGDDPNAYDVLDRQETCCPVCRGEGEVGKVKPKSKVSLKKLIRVVVAMHRLNVPATLIIEEN